MRSTHVTRLLPYAPDDLFALESLLDNLADLADRIDELAAASKPAFRPQAAPAGAP